MILMIRIHAVLPNLPLTLSKLRLLDRHWNYMNKQKQRDQTPESRHPSLKIHEDVCALGLLLLQQPRDLICKTARSTRALNLSNVPFISVD